MAMVDTGSEILREEFNRWAEAGRGEEMERHHLPIVEPTLALMNLRADDRILDVGCGSGWLARRLAAIVPKGRVVGIDVSDAMVRQAQLANANISNVEFLHGRAEAIPAPPGLFTRVLSVESAYYWPDPAQGVAEMFRVLATGGSAWILINYYRDNVDCHQWKSQFKIPTHLLSAADWQRHFHAAGFGNVTECRIPNSEPIPEVYTGRWFRDAAQMRSFQMQGALLISGTKLL